MNIADWREKIVENSKIENYFTMQNHKLQRQMEAELHEIPNEVLMVMKLCDLYRWYTDTNLTDEEILTRLENE